MIRGEQPGGPDTRPRDGPKVQLAPLLRCTYVVLRPRPFILFLCRLPAAMSGLNPAQVRNAVTTSRFTRDFNHLQSFPRYWLKRFSFSDPNVKAAKPKDRVKYWNIVPGDQVRVIGDAQNKILEVAKINRLTNRVYLKGATTSVRRHFIPHPMQY